MLQRAARRLSGTASSKRPPDRLDVAIIGGGVSGAAIHYHLAALGVRSGVFEKSELTSGATWHAY